MVLGFRGHGLYTRPISTHSSAATWGAISSISRRDAAQAEKGHSREEASEPPGPGKNSAGLGIFRYETRCGTVWGHTGNYPGYTQFAAGEPETGSAR